MAVGRDRAEGLRTAWKNIQVILHSDPATQDRHLNATQEPFYITITIYMYSSHNHKAVT